MTEYQSNIKVTLIGSFRKDPKKLRAVYERLAQSFEILSPKDIDFENFSDGFVKTKQQANAAVYDIEHDHLNAIRDSDFIFLHAPDGYVGISAAYEIGFSQALGIPVISDEPISDTMLASMVKAKTNQDDFLVNTKSGNGIKFLQNYYRKNASRRGWSEESARDTVLLLTEELGELARAIRKHEGLKRDHAYTNDIGEELADIQLYLVHLANVVGIDLADAVTTKEKKNTERFKNRK